ncbi:SxtJ family membrane protein [Candidatus Pelagibacter sp.]|nr:SxtJ family membrane protein [Candidatus Pelagibacter sp.]MDC0900536.1 SxtJ family membrane protein [Candidatus Pelagibacter sp.]MDC1070397.1 SxtJ family membrane protein [Candidatus Pelagibacter sp.]
MDKKINLPSNKNFGIVFFIVFLLIALYPLINNEEIKTWSILISLIFLFLGLRNSVILTSLNKLWYNFGLFLGKIVSPLVMGIIFFLVVTPIGLIMRLFGKDVLNLRYNKNNSYWIEKKDPKSLMKNQF